MTDVTCNICSVTTPISACETASVRSNVRRFREEKFALWRCPRCRSIHARDEVDLAHYYATYPMFPEDVESRLHPAYDNFLKRLVAAGLRKEDRILDYGCGSGALVRFLRLRGYAAEGYDAYSKAFTSEAVLAARYECVVSQDVIEHVASPHDLLRTFDSLVVPGGLIAIGTPDASAIDLKDPDDYVHTLHAPYHRHILSNGALRTAAEGAGWSVVRFYQTMYGNTLIPGQNPRFGLHYLRAHDDCLDLLTEPVRFGSARLFSPATPFFMFFGFFFDRHTDVMFTFRTKP